MIGFSWCPVAQWLLLSPLRVLVAICLVLAASATTAFADNPLAPLDTSSPRATFESFRSQAKLIEAHYRDYLTGKTEAKAKVLLRDIERLRTLFDLSQVPPATRDKVGGAAFGLLVDILVRLPEVPPETIPGAADHASQPLPTKWTVPGSEIHIQRVEAGPQAGEYLFSSDTVKRLPEFYALIIDQPPLRPVLHQSWREAQIRFTGPALPESLVSSIPEPLQRPVLDTPLWKVLLVLALAFAIVLVLVLWGTVVRRSTRGSGPVVVLLWRLSKPVLFAWLVYLAHFFVAFQVNLSGHFADGESIVAAVLLYSAGAWAAWLACFLLVESIIASPNIPDDSYDAHLLRLVARVGGLVAAGTIIVYGANDIGIPALGLVAGLGVGGFALALASQSTVENLFGGVSIFADRPFRVGEFIQYSDGSGTVESIGPRSSRIRGLDGTLTTVPNGDLAKMHITNISMRNKCLFLHTLGLRYETSPKQFEWVLAELRRRLADHPMIEKSPGFPRVRLKEFNSSSIDIEVRAYVLTPNFNEFLEVQEALILDIMKAVEAAGTGFAFPSQTAYIARDSGIDDERKAEIERGRPRRRQAGDNSETSYETEEADEDPQPAA